MTRSTSSFARRATGNDASSSWVVQTTARLGPKPQTVKATSLSMLQAKVLGTGGTAWQVVTNTLSSGSNFSCWCDVH